jgi:hypothetical protein
MFKFQPEAIWQMTIEDIIFWNKGAEQISKWKNSR